MINTPSGHTMSVAQGPSIRFAYGSNTFDSNPHLCMVESFEAFCRWIRLNKVPATGADAKGRTYICAPCAVAPNDDWHRQGTMVDSIGKEHRCKACSLPRQWLGFDIDKGLGPDWIDGLRYGLNGIDCLIYTTASHTSDAPRVRIVVLLNRPVSRAEGVQASVALRMMIDARLGLVGYGVPTWDRAADRGEQPLFMPPADSTFIRLPGDPANADALIANSLAAGAVADEDERRVLRRVDGDVELQATPGALTYLRMLCDRVRAALIGERNAALYAAAADAAKMDRLSDDLIGLELEQAALDAGMELSEIGKTIRSGVGHGRTQDAVLAVEDEFDVLDEELPPGIEKGDAWPPVRTCATPDPCTDLANAQRLVKAHGVSMLFCPGIGWHVWQPFGPWARDELAARIKSGLVGDVVRDEAIRYLQSLNACGSDEEREQMQAKAKRLVTWMISCGKTQTISNALTEAAPLLSQDVRALDSNRMLLGCPNGALDLMTGVLRPYRRDDFVTQTCGIYYEIGALAPRWRRFVSEVLGGDPALIERVQRYCGYVLTGLTTEHVLFIAYGSGSNGKSTFFEVLRRVLGSYAKTAAPGLLMARSGEQHPTELMDLRGARLMISSETGESGRMNEERVKALTGGDGIKARAMGKDFVDFESTAKLVICTNHKPIISGQDLGIWRRMWLVPFTQTFTGAAADKNLLVKLLAELPGILNWCLEGLAKWQAEGFNACAAIESASREYQAESDVLGAFIDEECERGEGFEVEGRELYTRYSQWCAASGIRAVAHAKLFGRRLEERGFGSKVGRVTGSASTVRLRLGLKLRDPWSG